MGKHILVIGGGPGGYVAAIRAAQLGANVTLVEREQIGGTCLNAGCIPTKALLHTADFYRKAVTNAVPGVVNSGTALDWPAAVKWKDAVVARLKSGIKGLLSYNNVTVIEGKASLKSAHSACVGDRVLEADAILLATGSVNAKPKFPGNELTGVIDSTQALSMTELPKSMVIVGGGVIGVEFAAMLNAVGTKTTLIEMTEEILPSFDAEIAGIMREKLQSDGVAVYTGAGLAAVEKSKGGLAVHFERAAHETIAAEKVLVAVGRQAFTEGLGLEMLGVSMERGAVKVDGNFETNLPGLFAIGDCNGTRMLAHAAMAQGVAAVNYIMGRRAFYNAAVVPSCIYAFPEAAAVGRTEQELKAAGIAYEVGRFSLSGNAKSLIEGEGGLIKILADASTGEVLGAHMIGPHVTEMISEVAMAMSMEGTVDEIKHTIHAHPTVNEAASEAAMAVFGRPIHGV